MMRNGDKSSKSNCNHTPNYTINGHHSVVDYFIGNKKSYFEEKNANEVRNREETVLPTDLKIPIFGDQHIQIYGFLDGFDL